MPNKGYCLSFSVDFFERRYLFGNLSTEQIIFVICRTNYLLYVNLSNKTIDLSNKKYMANDKFLFAISYPLITEFFDRKQKNFVLRMQAQKHLHRNNFFNV